MTSREILDFHLEAAPMTAPGEHAKALQALPRDIPALARVVQGLLLHEHWAPAYGVTLDDERRQGSHVRPVATLLDALVADGRPLDAARPLDQRFVCVCRSFSVLLVSMLRAQGVPARARCGFGAYFIRGQFEDHWVCEYWNAADARWVLVDAQLDPLQCGALRPDFDPADVPRDRFLVAGDAWALCRSAEVDPAKFGIADLRGLWFVAGNVLRDAAALCNMELLPWDAWGAMPTPGETPRPETLAFLDHVAALTRAPDASFAALRALHASDARLRVPPRVLNAIRAREEAL